MEIKSSRHKRAPSLNESKMAKILNRLLVWFLRKRYFRKNFMTTDGRSTRLAGNVSDTTDRHTNNPLIKRLLAVKTGPRTVEIILRTTFWKFKKGCGVVRETIAKPLVQGGGRGLLKCMRKRVAKSRTPFIARTFIYPITSTLWPEVYCLLPLWLNINNAFIYIAFYGFVHLQARAEWHSCSNVIVSPLSKRQRKTNWQ